MTVYTLLVVKNQCILSNVII